MAHPLGGGRGKLGNVGQQRVIILLAAGLIAGYFLGMVLMETADVMFTSGAERHLKLETAGPVTSIKASDNTSTVAVQTEKAAVKTEVAASKPDVALTEKAKAAATAVAAAVALSKPKSDPMTNGRSIHSLLTSNGSPYQNFQGRIMYGTYKLVQQMPGGEHLTGFTRIMHRTKDDELMNEIPTFRAKPLHPECDGYCDFPVADRANAVVQWVEAVRKTPSLLQGNWVLILECDYVWMKPMMAPDANSDAPSRQYHFDYICVNCVAPIVKRLFNNQDPVGKVANSGPAPALLRFKELELVAPDWERVTDMIEKDKEAVEKLGWVREMYAWSVAVALHPTINMVTEEPLVSPLIVQPPHEDRLGNASMCHYTWGAIYNDSTTTVWRWEKRDYTSPENALKVPHLPMPPRPFKPNTWHLQAREPVTEQLHSTLEAMIGQMNKAIDLLPDLSQKAGGVQS